MRRRFSALSKNIINNYLTIEALEDGLTVTITGSYCLYCIDGDKKWKLLDSGIILSINSGQTISLKDARYSTALLCGTLDIVGKFNLLGNVMSLLFGDNAANAFDLSNYDFAFGGLFAGCQGLQSISPTFLPATTLAVGCYSRMFSGCYDLITGPTLPATTLADYCYAHMFEDCSKLTTAPTLPATTLTNYCYQSMFEGCSKLNYIKMLATDISGDYCLYDWVNGVASTGSFVKNPDATWEVYGRSGIPNGWTVVMDGEEENNTFEFPIYLEIDEYDLIYSGDANNGYINNSKSPDFYSNLYSYLMQILKTYGNAYIGGWNLPNILDYGIEIYVHKSTGWVLIEEIDYYESDKAIFGWCWSDYCEISFISNAAYIKWFD